MIEDIDDIRVIPQDCIVLIDTNQSHNSGESIGIFICVYQVCVYKRSSRMTTVTIPQKLKKQIPRYNYCGPAAVSLEHTEKTMAPFDFP